MLWSASRTDLKGERPIVNIHVAIASIVFVVVAVLATATPARECNIKGQRQKAGRTHLPRAEARSITTRPASPLLTVSGWFCSEAEARAAAGGNLKV
jgi:hypothetical protein